MQLRTEVEVAAPAERVWAVLTDFSRYPDWNPFIARVTGELREGGILELSFTTSEGASWQDVVTLVAVKPGVELRWRSRLWFRGLFDSEHFVTLTPLSNGSTRLVQGADLSGLFLRFAGKRITELARGSVGMNQAVKRRVESA